MHSRLIFVPFLSKLTKLVNLRTFPNRSDPNSCRAAAVSPSDRIQIYTVNPRPLSSLHSGPQPNRNRGHEASVLFGHLLWLPPVFVCSRAHCPPPELRRGRGRAQRLGPSGWWRGPCSLTWSSGRLVKSLSGFSRLEPVQAVVGLSSAAMAPGLSPAAAAPRRRRRLRDPPTVGPSVCVLMMLLPAPPPPPSTASPLSLVLPPSCSSVGESVTPLVVPRGPGPRRVGLVGMLLIL